MPADTQESWGDYKNYVEKLSIVGDLAYPLAIGGAGIGDLIEPMNQEVIERAAQIKPATKQELEAMLKEAIAEVYRNDLPCLALKKQERTPEFLIGAKPKNDDFCIFRIKGRRLYRVHKRAIIGYGTPANNALLERMYRDNLPMQQAVMLAVYLVSHSKSLDESVGGNPTVAVVVENGAWIDDPEYIANSENRVKEFLRLTDELFLNAIDMSIAPSKFPDVLAEFQNKVTNLRDTYLRWSAVHSINRAIDDPTYRGDPYLKEFQGCITTVMEGGAYTVREAMPEEIADRKENMEWANRMLDDLANAEFQRLLRGVKVEYEGEVTVEVVGTRGKPNIGVNRPRSDR